MMTTDRPFSVDVVAVAEARSGMKTLVLTVDGVSYTVMILDDMHHIALTSDMEG